MPSNHEKFYPPHGFAIATLCSVLLACSAPDASDATETIARADEALTLSGLQASTLHTLGGCADHDDEHDSLELRELAARPLHWHGPDFRKQRTTKLKLLGFNDFHGQLSAGKLVTGRPVGGAAVLAAYLQHATQGFENRSLIVHAGDHVGASPPASALLQDEPSIGFLNLLGNRQCSYSFRLNPACNVVGTLGNHEFDEGKAELLRLVHGGNHAQGPFLEPTFRGARFPYVSANVVYAKSKLPLLPQFVIKTLGGIPIGVVGAVLKETPSIVTPTGVEGLRFLDEATEINRSVRALKGLGVKTIVVSVHQGGPQTSFIGPTQEGGVVSGVINDIVKNLDDEVDVVVSGHAHAFTNVLLSNKNGKKILVTQAFSASTAYADIELDVDRSTLDVVQKSAQIVTTFADIAPGNAPNPEVLALVKQAEDKTAPLVNRVVAESSLAILQTQNAAGESALGNLIADAQRAAVGADLGFMNPGGIRANLDAGPVTWGDLFTIQPFGNSLVKLSLTGQQIVTLLNQQWQGQPFARMLQISGLEYTWDNARPVGDRIVEVRRAGAPLDLTASYTVAANSFIAAGGDNFTVFALGTERVGGPVDLDALITHVSALTQPFSASVEGRITRLN